MLLSRLPSWGLDVNQVPLGGAEQRWEGGELEVVGQAIVQTDLMSLEL